MTDDSRTMWEILVPARTNDGEIIPLEYHRAWDTKVTAIAGGLTILKLAKGNWHDPVDGRVFSEPMIPVRIACSREQIDAIADLVATHYNQKAVLYYLVSPEVVIRYYQ